MDPLVIALMLAIGAGAAFFLLRLRYLGQRLAVLGPSAQHTERYQALLDDKRSSYLCLWGHLMLLLFVVFCVEVAARSIPHRHEHPGLLGVHLSLDTAFLGMVAFLRWKPGHRSRRFHRIGGYAALAVFTGSLATGLALAYLF